MPKQRPFNIETKQTKNIGTNIEKTLKDIKDV